MWAGGRGAMKELCAFWPCGSCVVFLGLFVVDFRWPVNTLLEMGVPEAQGGAVVGVVRLLPSFRSFDNTSGSSSHTPMI